MSSAFLLDDASKSLAICKIAFLRYKIVASHATNKPINQALTSYYTGTREAPILCSQFNKRT